RDPRRLIQVLSRVPPATLPGEEEHFRSSICDSIDHRGPGCPFRTACSVLRWLVRPPTTTSADFCPPLPTPLDASSQRQVNRPPRVMRATFTLMPAAFTAVRAVQVPGFDDIGRLTPHNCLVCDSCSSGQCFAFG